MQPVVRTSRGAVRGTVADGVAAFRGIPYAAPPVGERRFRAPVPAPRWDGTRPDIGFGPNAPQALRELPGIDARPLLGDGWVRGDEYLTLNVWTPDPPAGGLPVMVFFHGGAFIAGSSAAAIYDGTRLARDGVVLVSANYRLGVEGFLPLEGGDANCGLRDQLAVLAWVQEEIGAFGGDAANVTAFGQSAGAIALDLLLASPAARGLMRRVISQSGGARLTLSPEQAARITGALADRLGVAATRDGFAAVNVERTVAAQAQLVPGSVDLTTSEDRDPTGGMVVVLPVRDGELVPEDPLAAVRDGAGAEVGLMVGDTTEEAHLYLAGAPGFDVMTAEQARGMAALHHPDPDALLAAYRAARPEATPGELAAQVLTDAAFHIPTLRLAEARAGAAAPTYAYEFAWRSQALGGRLGACHGLDVPFVFGTLDAPGIAGETGILGPEGGPPELAERVRAAWVRYARAGDPGWAPFAPERTVMRIDAEWRERSDPRADEHRAWDGVI